MESRKRLYPWLKKHVDAEEFGLKWVDREKQCFSIPWLHRSNRAWNRNSCQIFKEWAKFTNRYREGEDEDWPGWKQRLRSALNKLCEQMVEMNNLDNAENPYRVYRFLSNNEKKDFPDSSPSTGGSPSSSQPTDGSPGSPQKSPYFDALSTNIYMDETEANSPSNAQCPGLNIPAVVPCCVNFNQSQVLMNILPGASQTSVIPNVNFISSLVKQEENIVDGTENLPTTNSLSSDLASIDSNNLISGSKLPSAEMNLYKSSEIKKPTILYKIFFLDEKVKEGLLYDNGAHLYFGNIPNIPHLPHIFGPKNLEQIPFPDLTSLKRSINSEQQRLMQGILLKMDRGFLLQCHEGDIYTQRLCQTRMYAVNRQIGSIVLDRVSKTPKKLFDFTLFKDKLENSPTDIASDTFLTFGQELKSPESFRKLLMHVELVHLEADELMQKSYCPSSIKSGVLFSDPDSGDKYLQEGMNHLNIHDDHETAGFQS